MDRRSRIGLAGAIGAFGGVLVDIAFGQTFLTTHNGDAAYLIFLGYYALCLALTWFCYVRPAARDHPPVRDRVASAEVGWADAAYSNRRRIPPTYWRRA